MACPVLRPPALMWCPSVSSFICCPVEQLPCSPNPLTCPSHAAEVLPRHPHHSTSARSSRSSALPLAPACPGVLSPQERRKELAKMVAKYGEESKVALRNVRKDVMKKIDKVEFSKVRWG